MLMGGSKWQDERTGAAAPGRLGRASETSHVIRQKLAAVAEELRLAAATADKGREELLALANRFERDSKPGDHA